MREAVPPLLRRRVPDLCLRERLLLLGLRLRRGPVPGPNPLPAGTASLRVGTKYLVIVPGQRLMAHQIPGLAASSGEGLVAEITRNPNDPEVLGLTNLSTASWEVVTSNNTRREIAQGRR